MLKTAESLRAGHPDKLADLIADSILDEALAGDPAAKVAVEVLATKARVLVAGEITSNHKKRIPATVRLALAERGYDPRAFCIRTRIQRQSGDIADGVDHSLETRHGKADDSAVLGAGDQGTVYGYATSETAERLSLPLVYAHRICRGLDQAWRDGAINGLGVDGKAQVTINYQDGKPARVACVVVSAQHEPGISIIGFTDAIQKQIINPACRESSIDGGTVVLVNPSGRFVEGGPEADTGPTGRKLMVDTYGGLAPRGGGAFSGKDPSKVNRTGAYMARLITKTIVDAGLAEEAQIAISYAIGKAEPVAFEVDTLGTGQYSDEQLTKACAGVFPLRPAAMIDALHLGAGAQFSAYSAYGYFGNTQSAWENTTAWINKLRDALAVGR